MKQVRVFLFVFCFLTLMGAFVCLVGFFGGWEEGLMYPKLASNLLGNWE